MMTSNQEKLIRETLGTFTVEEVTMILLIASITKVAPDVVLNTLVELRKDIHTFIRDKI